jgi:hypothetical protein
MSAEWRYDVFLSYSSKDKAVVRAIAARLNNDGIRVWLDEDQIKPGDNIPAKIEEGLEHSRVLVLCMSANAFGSDWGQLEAGTFRFRDPLNKQRRFIPLRLDNASIKGSLAQFLYVDLRHNYEFAIQALVERCKSKEESRLEDSDRHPERPPVRTGLVRFPDSWTEYQVLCPCDLAQVRQAMEVGRARYGPRAISFDQFRAWMAANKYVLVSLMNQGNELVGYFDILPLKKAAFDNFVIGKIDEHEINGQHILSPKEGFRTERLYFAGIAARGFGNLFSLRNASVLIRQVFRFIEEFYPPHPQRELYAIAATDDGTRLLTELQFEVVSPAEERIDNCDLYRYIITPASLKSAHARFKRLDGFCREMWRKPN